MVCRETKGFFWPAVFGWPTTMSYRDVMMKRVRCSRGCLGFATMLGCCQRNTIPKSTASSEISLRHSHTLRSLTALTISAQNWKATPHIIVRIGKAGGLAWTNVAEPRLLLICVMIYSSRRLWLGKLLRGNELRGKVCEKYCCSPCFCALCWELRRQAPSQ